MTSPSHNGRNRDPHGPGRRQTDHFGRRHDDDYPKVVIGPKAIATLVVISNTLYAFASMLIPGGINCL